VDDLSAVHKNASNYSSCSISKILYQNFNILHIAFPAFSSTLFSKGVQLGSAVGKVLFEMAIFSG